MSYREGRFWQPDVTVATLVARDGRLLCVEERVGGRLVLNQPAGHLEPDESLVEAALRETREETGWHVRITHLVGDLPVEGAGNRPPLPALRLRRRAGGANSRRKRWTRASCRRCG